MWLYPWWYLTSLIANKIMPEQKSTDLPVMTQTQSFWRVAPVPVYPRQPWWDILRQVNLWGAHTEYIFIDQPHSSSTADLWGLRHKIRCPDPFWIICFTVSKVLHQGRKNQCQASQSHHTTLTSRPLRHRVSDWWMNLQSLLYRWWSTQPLLQRYSANSKVTDALALYPVSYQGGTAAH